MLIIYFNFEITYNSVELYFSSSIGHIVKIRTNILHVLHKSLEEFITILLTIGCLGYWLKFLELQTSNMNNVPLKFFSFLFFLKNEDNALNRYDSRDITNLSRKQHCRERLMQNKIVWSKIVQNKKKNQQFTILGLTTVLFVEY